MKRPDVSELISFLATYGERYRRTYLRGYIPERLRTDWWQALKFFLSHAVNVGRCDEVSAKVCEQALEVLSPLFSGLDGQTVYKQNQEEGWTFVCDQLRKRIGAGKIGKGGDVLMVRATLESLKDLEDRNLVRHTVKEIQGGRLKHEYRRLDQIYQVGDKITSVYLRDIASIFKLDNYIPADEAMLLMPVDTHVRNVAIESQIARVSMNDNQIRKSLVEQCMHVRVSPLLVNQGAWNVRKNYPAELRAALQSTRKRCFAPDSI